MRLLTMAAAPVLPTLATRVVPEPTRPQAGDTCEIRSACESSQESNEESSGSSTDRDGLIERVVGVHDLGWSCPPTRS